MTEKKTDKHYIVYCFSRYQDCSEEHVYLFNSIEGAIAHINDSANRTNGGGRTLHYNLFELGKEIPIGFTKELVHQPVPAPTEKIIYKVNK